MRSVAFIAMNTDAQALLLSNAPIRIRLGDQVTNGLGSGGDPEVGERAAKESIEDIYEAVRGADMVFITAGMGGGTGTGAAPIAAEIAREVGAIVIAVVTMPFSFEMSKRSQNALEGVRQIQPHAHTLITVPNDRLLQVVPRDLSLEIAFRIADDVLRQGVQGIAELVTRPGLINVDFAHVREIMTNGGGAYMAIGLGKGEGKAPAAIKQALHHPLLEIDGLDSATGILVHFTGGEDLTLHEVGEAVEKLRNVTTPDIDIILGATTDPAMTGRAQVILIFTGVGGCPVAAVQGFEEVAIAPSSQTQNKQIDDLDLPTFLRRRAAVGSRS